MFLTLHTVSNRSNLFNTSKLLFSTNPDLLNSTHLLYLISADSHIHFMSYFCNIKGQTRQARWLLTNLTFYNQISEFFLLSIICVKSGFNLSCFYFKPVLEDKSYITLSLYHHFLHQTAPKSLIEFLYQSALFFQYLNESLE